MIKECLECHKNFDIANWNKDRKFCSNICYWKNKLGKPSQKRRVENNGEWKCSVCKKFQPEDNFPQDKSKFNGIHTTCKLCHANWSKKYWSKNNVIEKHKIKDKEKRDFYRSEVIKFLGGKCVKCGFNDYRALQIDHINGGGRKEKKSLVSVYRYNRSIFNQIINQENKKYQLLCANCNWIKRFTNNEQY